MTPKLIGHQIKIMFGIMDFRLIGSILYEASEYWMKAKKSGYMVQCKDRSKARYVMSDFIFLMVVDWVMRKTTEGSSNDLIYNLHTTLHLCLQHMKNKAEKISCLGRSQIKQEERQLP